jgi:hypothetical protein
VQRYSITFNISLRDAIGAEGGLPELKKTITKYIHGLYPKGGVKISYIIISEGSTKVSYTVTSVGGGALPSPPAKPSQLSLKGGRMAAVLGGIILDNCSSVLISGTDITGKDLKKCPQYFPLTEKEGRCDNDKCIMITDLTENLSDKPSGHILGMYKKMGTNDPFPTEIEKVLEKIGLKVLIKNAPHGAWTRSLKSAGLYDKSDHRRDKGSYIVQAQTKFNKYWVISTQIDVGGYYDYLGSEISTPDAKNKWNIGILMTGNEQYGWFDSRRPPLVGVVTHNLLSGRGTITNKNISSYPDFSQKTNEKSDSHLLALPPSEYYDTIRIVSIKPDVNNESFSLIPPHNFSSRESQYKSNKYGIGPIWDPRRNQDVYRIDGDSKTIISGTLRDSMNNSIPKDSKLIPPGDVGDGDGYRSNKDKPVGIHSIPFHYNAPLIGKCSNNTDTDKSNCEKNNGQWNLLLDPAPVKDPGHYRAVSSFDDKTLTDKLGFLNDCEFRPCYSAKRPASRPWPIGELDDSWFSNDSKSKDVFIGLGDKPCKDNCSDPYETYNKTCKQSPVKCDATKTGCYIPSEIWRHKLGYDDKSLFEKERNKCKNVTLLRGRNSLGRYKDEPMYSIPTGSECKIKCVYPDIKDEKNCKGSGKEWYKDASSSIGFCRDINANTGIRCENKKITWPQCQIDKKCDISPSHFGSPELSTYKDYTDEPVHNIKIHQSKTPPITYEKCIPTRSILDNISNQPQSIINTLDNDSRCYPKCMDDLTPRTDNEYPGYIECKNGRILNDETTECKKKCILPGASPSSARVSNLRSLPPLCWQQNLPVGQGAGQKEATKEEVILQKIFYKNPTEYISKNNDYKKYCEGTYGPAVPPVVAAKATKSGLQYCGDLKELDIDKECIYAVDTSGNVYKQKCEDNPRGYPKMTEPGEASCQELSDKYGIHSGDWGTAVEDTRLRRLWYTGFGKKCNTKPMTRIPTPTRGEASCQELSDKYGIQSGDWGTAVKDTRVQGLWDTGFGKKCNTKPMMRIPTPTRTTEPNYFKKGCSMINTSKDPVRWSARSLPLNSEIVDCPTINENNEKCSFKCKEGYEITDTNGKQVDKNDKNIFRATCSDGKWSTYGDDGQTKIKCSAKRCGREGDILEYPEVRMSNGRNIQPKSIKINADGTGTPWTGNHSIKDGMKVNIDCDKLMFQRPSDKLIAKGGGKLLVTCDKGKLKYDISGKPNDKCIIQDLVCFNGTKACGDEMTPTFDKTGKYSNVVCEPGTDDKDFNCGCQEGWYGSGYKKAMFDERMSSGAIKPMGIPGCKKCPKGMTSKPGSNYLERNCYCDNTSGSKENPTASDSDKCKCDTSKGFISNIAMQRYNAGKFNEDINQCIPTPYHSKCNDKKIDGTNKFIWTGPITNTGATRYGKCGCKSSGDKSYELVGKHSWDENKKEWTGDVKCKELAFVDCKCEMGKPPTNCVGTHVFNNNSSSKQHIIEDTLCKDIKDEKTCRGEKDNNGKLICSYRDETKCDRPNINYCSGCNTGFNQTPEIITSDNIRKRYCWKCDEKNPHYVPSKGGGSLCNKKQYCPLVDQYISEPATDATKAVCKTCKEPTKIAWTSTRDGSDVNALENGCINSAIHSPYCKVFRKVELLRDDKARRGTNNIPLGLCKECKTGFSVVNGQCFPKNYKQKPSGKLSKLSSRDVNGNEPLTKDSTYLLFSIQLNGIGDMKLDIGTQESNNVINELRKAIVSCINIHLNSNKQSKRGNINISEVSIPSMKLVKDSKSNYDIQVLIKSDSNNITKAEMLESLENDGKPIHFKYKKQYYYIVGFPKTLGHITKQKNTISPPLTKPKPKPSPTIKPSPTTKKRVISTSKSLLGDDLKLYNSVSDNTNEIINNMIQGERKFNYMIRTMLDG